MAGEVQVGQKTEILVLNVQHLFCHLVQMTSYFLCSQLMKLQYVIFLDYLNCSNKISRLVS